LGNNKSIIAGAIAFLALAGCQSFSVATKGWTQITALNDTVTAQCNWEKQTLDVNGKIIHISSGAQAVKVGKFNISCDLPTKTLIMSYGKSDGK